MPYSTDKKLHLSITNETPNGFFQVLCAVPREGIQILDYMFFFLTYFLEFGRLLQARVESEDVEFIRNRKFLGLLHARMVKRDEHGVITDSFEHWFHKKAISLHGDAQGLFEKLMNLMANDICNDIAHYTTQKSGWTFDRVLAFHINITRCRVAANRGACENIPTLPKSIPRKALIIINRATRRLKGNIGSNCFIDALSVGCYVSLWESLNSASFNIPNNSTSPGTWLKLFKEDNFKLTFVDELRNVLSVEANKTYLFENKNTQYFVTILTTDGEAGYHTVRTYNTDRLIECRRQKQYPPLFVNILLYKHHYFPIKSLSSLLRNNNTLYVCHMCLHSFRQVEILNQHVQHCNGLSIRRISMPKEGAKLDFSKYRKFSQRHPVVIYADTETIHIKNDTTCGTKRNILDRHIPFMVSYYVAFSKEFRVVLQEASNNPYNYPIWGCANGEVERFEDFPNNLYKVFTGENCMEDFLDSLFDLTEKLGRFMSRIKMKYCKKEFHFSKRIKTEINCNICGKEFNLDDENLKPVVDHDHWTGIFRGIVHNACNVVLRQQKRFFPIVFHNFKNYDSHLICRYAKFTNKENLSIGVIPISSEKYLSLSLKWKVGEFIACNTDVEGNQTEKTIILRNEIRFIDSYQFLSVKLETLINQLGEDELFYHTRLNFKSESSFALAKRKGIYPYAYMDSFSKLSDTALPPIEAFKNDLDGGALISEKEYNFAQRVWITENCQTMEDYTRFYLKVDVVTLADVFENFRSTCLSSTFKQDPIFYYSLPGLSWAAMLRTTQVEFDLLTDYELHCFFEAGIRGGIVQCTKNYSEADNIYTKPDAHTSPNDLSRYLYLFDANGLYSWALSQPLPCGDFHFIDDQNELKNLFLRGPENFPDVMGLRGYVVMVDIEYPTEIHDKTASYPLAPSHETINITDYSLMMLNQWKRTHLSTFNIKPEKKLVATCSDKDDYVIHFRTLQFYLEMGLRIKAIKRAVSFRQEAFMKVYIDSNITERKKHSDNKAKSDFYKLLNNAVYGKTVESQRRYKNIKLSSNPKEQLKLVGKNTFQGSTVISDNLVAFLMMREKVELNKPIYVGQAVLDLSKLLMFKFYYTAITPLFSEVNVVYTDTDSLLLDIFDRNVEKKLIQIRDEWLDGSNMPPSHPLHTAQNKGVLGFFKDEMNGVPIDKIVALRPKMYCVRCIDKSEKTKAKGIQEAFVKKNFTFNTYYDAYIKSIEAANQESQDGKVENLRKIVSFNSFQSIRHEVFTVEQKKCGLLLFDNKRYWTKINSSLPYSHWKSIEVHENEQEIRKQNLLEKYNIDLSKTPLPKRERAMFRYPDEYCEKRKASEYSVRDSEQSSSDDDHEYDDNQDYYVVDYNDDDDDDSDDRVTSFEFCTSSTSKRKMDSFIDDSEAIYMPSTSKKPRFNEYFDMEAGVD